MVQRQGGLTGVLAFFEQSQAFANDLGGCLITARGDARLQNAYSSGVSGTFRLARMAYLIDAIGLALCQFLLQHLIGLHYGSMKVNVPAAVIIVRSLPTSADGDYS